MIITKLLLAMRDIPSICRCHLCATFVYAMVPAFSTTVKSAARSGPAHRGFVYVPNGVAMKQRAEFLDAEGHRNLVRVSPILSLLAPTVSGRPSSGSELKNRPSRLATAMKSTCAPAPRGSMVFTRRRPSGSDIRRGPTADQIAALEPGKETVLPSMEMISSEIHHARRTVRGGGQLRSDMNTISWQSPTTPLLVENNPRWSPAAVRRGGTPEQRLDRMKKKRSMLDCVNQDLLFLQSLGRVRSHGAPWKDLDAVWLSPSAESRWQRSRIPIRLCRFEIGQSVLPLRYDYYLKLLYDLQWLAFEGAVPHSRVLPE